MASIGVKIKNLSKRKKICLFLVISFFVFILTNGVKRVFAFFEDSYSISILANAIGDFDAGNGDVTMILYKEDNSGVFVKTNSIPVMGYKFDNSKTTCTNTCKLNDSTANCYYAYNTNTGEMSLTSNKKVTCKFYFTKEADADINLNIMIEDSYDSNTYKVAESIPAYGYVYANRFTCGNSNTTVTYNSETRKFTVSVPTKDSCDVYFDSIGNSDIIVDVYVQTESGSSLYEEVDSIPTGKVYLLSTSKTSACVDEENNSVDANITYSNGYLNVSSNSDTQLYCKAYLDLAS